MDSPPTRFAAGIAALLVCALSVIAAARYPGSTLVFAAFAILGNAVLLNGLRKRAIFIDTFIGLFFWLGFFLKVAVRVAFLDGKFSEPVGAFDGSGAAFDHALMVCSTGFAGVLAASWIRQRFFVYPQDQEAIRTSGLYRFYNEHRQVILPTFVALIILVAFSNSWMGIYQRGMVAHVVLPFGLNGIYKWLLQFGLASISALLIRYEIERVNTLTNAALFIPLFESFLCNVSLLSRGMVLNVAGLVAGTWRLLIAIRAKIGARRVLLAAFSFVVIFGISVFSVNYLRSAAWLPSVAHVRADLNRARIADNATQMSKSLFIDRWVGIEGVLAVSAAPDLGWDLMREAWREKYQEGRLSLYDRQFITSPYRNLDLDGKFHYVSLPGLLAFLYYSGSTLFVFAGTLVLALLAALFELACFRFCGKNLVLCSLFAQVIAFRYASFGYVPAQSYLLFGTLVLNCALIAWADHILTWWYGRKLEPVAG